MTARWGLASLFLCATALRPQLVIVGPLLPLITADMGLTFTMASLLALIPLVCMGVFALPAGRVAGLIGPRAGLALCLAGVAAFGIARALAPSEVALILLTVPIGVAMGLGGALLPGYVKRRFPERPAFATGVYTNAFQVSSTLAGLLAVPVAVALDGWRGALIVAAVLALVSLTAWLVLTEREPVPRSTRLEAGSGLPWRSRIAWALALTFGLRSVVFQGLLAWLPTIYVERGWDEASAGALVSLMILANIPTTFAATWLADRVGARRTYLSGASIALLVATLGLVLVPDAVVLWVLTVGAALGVLFPLTLTLPLDVADTPTAVAGIAGIMLAGGYLIASAGPLGLGVTRDLSGGFGVALAALVATSVVLVVVTLILTPERLARRPRPATATVLAEP